VTLLCVGKLKERYYAEAFAEYQKRLGAYCRFAALELPEQRLPDAPSEKEISASLRKEAAEIRAHIPDGAVLIALCVEGQQMSSPALAERLGRWMDAGRSRLCFVVGGSFGLSEEIKAAADLRLSFSEMTFPHHLFRVMLAEQIYRAFSISAGTRYHK
jgi:23S rRNA (pseudouridine1915-N3)-methyltransferase